MVREKLRKVPVVVDWDDAFIDTNDFSDTKGGKMKPIRRYTIGWYIGQNERGVVLATDHYHKEKYGNAAPMVIPWGMINRWYELDIQ